MIAKNRFLWKPYLESGINFSQRKTGESFQGEIHIIVGRMSWWNLRAGLGVVDGDDFCGKSRKSWKTMNWREIEKLEDQNEFKTIESE